jgi:hypothetical protein
MAIGMRVHSARRFVKNCGTFLPMQDYAVVADGRTARPGVRCIGVAEFADGAAGQF